MSDIEGNRQYVRELLLLKEHDLAVKLKAAVATAERDILKHVSS
jgi:hypothetical protein